MIGNMGILSPELRGISCRQNCYEQLKDIPSDELSDLVRDIFQKHGDEKLTSFHLAFAPRYDDLFLSAGAVDVLRERHGEDYVCGLLGCRKPANWKEKLAYFFTGDLPKAKD